MKSKLPFSALVRKVHKYTGLFFAPAIIFFSITGILQVFGLHEAEGGRPQPPAIVAASASLHKHQAIFPARPPRKPAAVAPGGAKPAEATQEKEEKAPPLSRVLLQWFTTLMSATLIASSLSGVYLALKFGRDRAVVIGLLVAGVAVPVGFLLL